MQQLLIVGKVWPEPASSAAGSRMMQLIKFFSDSGWKISFGSPANESGYTTNVKGIGVNKVNIELNNKSFDSLLKKLQPDAVLFDRFTTEEQFGWRVAEHCPNAIRIRDTEDLHCLRAARHTALKENRSFKLSDLNNEIAKRELASIYRSDLSLIISTFEMNVLTKHFKVDKSLLHYVPFLFEKIKKEQTSLWPSFSERKGFISIGNFLHEPNWDSALWLKKEIWPLIRKQLPKALLHIYGAYPSHKVFQLHAPKDGFYIKGRADDVSAIMKKSRVCLAPLRFGAGLKGKLADAMMFGTPNVTTAIGAEAMKKNLSWGGLIADTPEEISKAAVKLYTDETLWNKSQQNGIKIINTLFSKSELKNKLAKKIAHLQKNLPLHRSANFTGAMLTQHSILSSRYMALWIEAKNKK